MADMVEASEGTRCNHRASPSQAVRPGSASYTAPAAVRPDLVRITVISASATNAIAT